MPLARSSRSLSVVIPASNQEPCIDKDRSRSEGLFICQVGVDYCKRPGGHSTLSSVPTILKILAEMLRQYPALRRTRPAS